MKVLLTHGYFLGEDVKEQRIMRPYPPLGILCLAAYLDARGVAAEVFDSTFASQAALRQRLLEAPAGCARHLHEPDDQAERPRNHALRARAAGPGADARGARWTGGDPSRRPVPRSTGPT